MSKNTLGKWLKAVAGFAAALGIYTFTEPQLNDIAEWVFIGWAFIECLINTMQAYVKSKKKKLVE